MSDSTPDHPKLAGAGLSATGKAADQFSPCEESSGATYGGPAGTGTAEQESTQAHPEENAGQHSSGDMEGRLNRGGDRQANSALWRIAIVRLGTDASTRAYVDKRLGQGKSRTKAIRCLKRYIAREVYAVLPRPAAV